MHRLSFLLKLAVERRTPLPDLKITIFAVIRELLAKWLNCVAVPAGAP